MPEHPAADPAREVERLDTGGRVTGWTGVVLAVALAAWWVVRRLGPAGDALPLPVLTGALLAGVLFWAVSVRPAVLVSGDRLVLRNLSSTVSIPLAGIEEHALTQVLAVRAGGRRWIGTGVGRSLRKAALGGHAQGRLGQPGHVGDVGDPRRSFAAGLGGGTSATVDAADFVEARIADLCADARTRAGVERWSPEQEELGRTTQRRTTWPVVAALLGSLALFVASLAL